MSDRASGVSVRIEKRGPAMVARVEGDVDSTSSSDFEAALARGIGEEAKNVVFDLGGVRYFSSAGWNVLLHLARSIKKQGGSTALARMSSAVEHVYRLLGLRMVFASHPTVEDALRALTGSDPEGERGTRGGSRPR